MLIFSIVSPLIVGVVLNIFLRSRDHTTVSEAIVAIVYVQHFVLLVVIGYAAALVGVDISKYSSGSAGGFFPMPIILPIMAVVFLFDFALIVAGVYSAAVGINSVL